MKLKLVVVDAAFGLPRTILFVIAELEQLVVAAAVTVAEAADTVAVVAAEPLAADTVALSLQCCWMCEETEPRFPKDLARHRPFVAAAVAALEQLVAVDATDVTAAAEAADIAAVDDAVAVVQMTPFVDAVDLNSTNNTDCSELERPAQHLQLKQIPPLNCSYQPYGTNCRDFRSLRHGEGHWKMRC